MSRRSESVGYAIAAGRYARHLQGQREAPRKRIAEQDTVAVVPSDVRAPLPWSGRWPDRRAPCAASESMAHLGDGGQIRSRGAPLAWVVVDVREELRSLDAQLLIDRTADDLARREPQRVLVEQLMGDGLR